MISEFTVKVLIDRKKYSEKMDFQQSFSEAFDGIDEQESQQKRTVGLLDYLTIYSASPGSFSFLFVNCWVLFIKFFTFIYPVPVFNLLVR